MNAISVKQSIETSPAQVREVLLEHEQLNRFFNAAFLLIKPHDEGEIIGGKGVIRQVSMLGGNFQERIISADDKHISYQIIGNKPVADHRGDIYFSSVMHNNQPITDITYNISCKAPKWLPSFILFYFIKKDITQALKKLATHFQRSAL